MNHRWRNNWIIIGFLLAGIFALGAALPVFANPLAQQFTASPTLMATVTGTPAGVIVTVTNENEQVNVRSGPNTTYPKVGILLAGQQVPAKGRSPGGDWVLIEYVGIDGNLAWVYSYNLNIPSGSFLPVVEPPPTPTPLVTPTLDQTLAAQFLVTVAPTRLPTFTPPPDLVIPTLPGDLETSPAGGVPMGLIIIGLGTLGAFLGLVSLIRGR